MKKTNKISNTSKKAIRYISLATGLMVASLPGKAKADLLNVNAEVTVPGIAAVGAGVDVGNGVNVAAGANVLGVGAGVNVGALSADPAYGYAQPVEVAHPVPSGCVRIETPRGPYYSTTYTVPAAPVYAAPVEHTVYRPAYRPAPMVVPTTGTTGMVTVKESVDAVSYETPNTEYSQKTWQKTVDDQIQQYRSQEFHRETTKRRVYYTYGY